MFSLVRKSKVSNALKWLKQNNSLYRAVLIDQSTIDTLLHDDVPECLWKTIQVSADVEAGVNERTGYVSDPLLNISRSSDPACVPLFPGRTRANYISLKRSYPFLVVSWM